MSGLDDPTLEDAVGPTAWQELRDAAELLEGAGHAFDRKQFEYGRVIPVFFGSAVNNFGVEPFLRAVIELAPPPSPRHAKQNGEDIELEPISDIFTGFVFKIQANMDKRHRDRLAFMRITSGVFEKDMAVQHARLGREVRMTRPHRLFARERETIERAYPGDVIGFVNPGLFQIGDAVSSGAPVEFDRIPRFAPEHFATLRAKQVTRQKQFQKGLEQLEEEGAMQVFVVHDGLRSEPILAVVGELQFEVLQSRLETEYNVETTITSLPYKLARWVDRDVDEVARMTLPTRARVATDSSDHAGRALHLGLGARVRPERKSGRGVQECVLTTVLLASIVLSSPPHVRPRMGSRPEKSRNSSSDEAARLPGLGQRSRDRRGRESAERETRFRRAGAVARQAVDRRNRGRAREAGHDRRLRRTSAHARRRRPRARRDVHHGRQGALVCATAKTTDYWQGDEAKWQRAFNEGKGAVFIDRPKFDDSSAQRLAQISVPVLDKGVAIGAITVGVSLDKLKRVATKSTHRFRIHAARRAPLAVRDRRDLARLDLAAAAPEDVRVARPGCRCAARCSSMARFVREDERPSPCRARRP